MKELVSLIWHNKDWGVRTGRFLLAAAGIVAIQLGYTEVGSAIVGVGALLSKQTGNEKEKKPNG